MAGTTFENGYGLIIGVGADLPTTVKDAKAIHKLLINPSRGAYTSDHLRILTENHATRKRLLEAFDALIAQVAGEPDAAVIIYFSGHGAKYEQPDKAPTYLLIPNDYNPSLPEESAISGREFTEKLEALHVRRMVVLLDCCHAGGMPDLKRPKAHLVKSPVPPELLQELHVGSGSVVVASSSRDELSYIGAKYSVFTECLLEALAGRGGTSEDGFARVLDVLSYLYKEVPKRAPQPQHPFVKKIYDLSDNYAICYYAGGDKTPAYLRARTRPERAPSQDARLAQPGGSIRQSGIRHRGAELPQLLKLNRELNTLLRPLRLDPQQLDRSARQLHRLVRDEVTIVLEFIDNSEARKLATGTKAHVAMTELGSDIVGTYYEIDGIMERYQAVLRTIHFPEELRFDAEILDKNREVLVKLRGVFINKLFQFYTRMDGLVKLLDQLS